MEENTPVEQTPTPAPAGRPGLPMPFIVVGLVALLLICVGAILFGRDYLAADTAVTEEGTAVATSESPAEMSAVNAIAGEIALSGTGSVASVPPAEFAALSTLPAGANAKSNVYTIADAAEGSATITVPSGVQPTDDLFGWDGTNWHFLPSTVSPSGQELVSAPGVLPQAVVVAQQAAPTTPAIALDVQDGQTVATAALPYTTELHAGGLRLAAQGQLEGTTAEAPQGGYGRMVLASNAGVIVDQTSLTELLADPALRTSHMQLLVNAVVAGEYAGLNLDYQGVPAGQEADFTLFVTDLANNLHSQSKVLGVTIGAPTAEADGRWSTGGQNLAALGQIADVVYLQMPLDPAAYTDNGPATELLAWATHQVDRSKLMMQVDTNAVDQLGGILRPVSLPDALATLGQISMGATEAVTAEVELNTPVELALDSNATPLVWDGNSLTYQFSYDDAGSPRTIWLHNEASLAYRLRLAKQFGLRGAAVTGLGNLPQADSYAAALESVVNGGEMPQPAGAAIVWMVENAQGGVIASTSSEAPTFAWDGTDLAGNYTISAGFAQGDTTLALGTLPVVVGTPAEEVAADEPTETAEEPSAEPTKEAGQPATAAITPNATVNLDSNVRTGPAVIYATVEGGAPGGTRVAVIGRDNSTAAVWYNIVLEDGREGWIFATLVTLDASVDVASLPVVQSSATPVGTASAGGGGGGGSTAPAPVAAPAANIGSFELGGQTQSLGNPQVMQYAGMKWVKFQHKWGCGNVGTDLTARINQAHGNGFKVLLSIPGSPYPSGIDFPCYVSFLGEVAKQGPDAIEVWNEMNIDFEWPAGQIDPASYVNNMLAPAYNAIKAANPNVMVISGAPAPTGYFGGGCAANGCDDNAYLAGMAAAGAARYMDCMGVHYNAGATAPSATSGHPAGNNHYSWYLKPMIDVYYNALGRPLCFTELGYLSGQDFGGVPARFNWAGATTVSQHAQWLAEAVSIASNTGKVRMAIIFNVDFTTWGDDPQAGYAMIRKDGSCPACETLRQVMGN